MNTGFLTCYRLIYPGICVDLFLCRYTDECSQVKQKKNRGGLPRRGAGEICEGGSETSRLVGARERRGGQGEASQAHLSAWRGSVRVDRQDNRPRKDVAAK